jgi:hypothetical protein
MNGCGVVGAASCRSAEAFAVGGKAAGAIVEVGGPLVSGLTGNQGAVNPRPVTGRRWWCGSWSPGYPV